jgi:glycosyltransferase involved in cell wall biosynthesis
MRILQLNPFYFPYAGGIERRIRAMSHHLAERGHDVHILTSQIEGTSAGAQDEDGVTVHRLASRFRLKRLYNPPLVKTPGVAKAIEKLAPDVVDYHFRWSGSYTRPVRRMQGPASVITYHNTYGEGRGLLGALSRLNDRLYMRTLRTADRIVAVSRFLRDDLAAHGAQQDKLRIVPNGIDAHALLNEVGAPELHVDGPFVVAVGRLVAVKGLDILVEALAKAPKHLHLVIIGQGPEGRPLERQAQRLGLAERVHLTGWIDEKEKVRLLKAALAYVHPARFEAFGLSVLEAMAAGAPVMAARTGGLPEVVGDAGLLLDHEPASWAAGLARLAQEPGLRKALMSKGQERARSFDWKPLAQDLERVYEEAQHA